MELPDDIINYILSFVEKPKYIFMIQYKESLFMYNDFLSWIDRYNTEQFNINTGFITYYFKLLLRNRKAIKKYLYSESRFINN